MKLVDKNATRNAARRRKVLMYSVLSSVAVMAMAAAKLDLMPGFSKEAASNDTPEVVATYKASKHLKALAGYLIESNTLPDGTVGGAIFMTNPDNEKTKLGSYAIGENNNVKMVLSSLWGDQVYNVHFPEGPTGKAEVSYINVNKLTQALSYVLPSTLKDEVSQPARSALMLSQINQRKIGASAKKTMP